MRVFDKKDIEKIRFQYENDLKVKRKDKIFHQNMIDVRKIGLFYNYSREELKEYGRCLDLNYFIDKYTNTVLHGFQKDIIEHFKENKFSINMRSRQTGIGRTMMLYFLHEILFNDDRSIIIFNDKGCESKELSNIFKEIYKSLPFFLQVGVKVWNVNNITFENGSRLTFRTYSKTPAIGFNNHIWVLNDFANVPESYATEFYRSVFPIVAALQDCKLIISTPPNGFNFFYDLMQDAESGSNAFKPIKTYWWQVPNRGEEWKKEEINKLGSKYFFAQEYDLCFIKK